MKIRRWRKMTKKVDSTHWADMYSSDWDSIVMSTEKVIVKLELKNRSMAQSLKCMLAGLISL